MLLDGIDGLVHAGDAGFMDRLLEASEGVSVLSTSRLRPVLPEVLEIPVRPLDQCEDLFSQVALSVQPFYDPTPAESEAVAEICRRVGGLPLAVVLAASRLRDMTVADLADMVHEGSLRVLSGERGDRASLGLFQTIGSSVDRLAPEDARFLRSMAVFRGQFGAPEVAEVSGLNRFAAMDALRRLRDHSLVEADLTGGQAKYSLLDPIREYLEETTPPEDEERLRARYAHAKLAGDRARKVRESMDARKWAEASEVLWTYQADFRSAAAFADEHGLFPIVGSIADSLSRIYFESGIWAELDTLLTLARRACAETGDRALASRLLGIQGALSASLGHRDESRELQRERAALCAELGDPSGRADALLDLASSDFWNTAAEQVESHLAEAEIAATESGKPELLGSVYVIRATLAVRTEDAEAARHWAQKATELPRVDGDQRQMFIDAYAGQAFSFAEDLALAEACFRRVLVAARNTESRLHIAVSLQGIAKMNERQGRTGLAARCLLAVADYWRSIGSNRTPSADAETARLKELFPDAFKAVSTGDVTLFAVADEILAGVC
ncbi:hypothetical protein EON79_13785 [bacterium]|nr:MAG: hypothetical protein EON79_13785 [bacterium]